MEEVDFANAKIDLYEIEKSSWKNNIVTIHKLRTYSRGGPCMTCMITLNHVYTP